MRDKATIMYPIRGFFRTKQGPERPLKMCIQDLKEYSSICKKIYNRRKRADTLGVAHRGSNFKKDGQ